MVDRPSRDASGEGPDQGLIALVGGGLFTLSLFILPMPVTDVLRLFVAGDADTWMVVFTSAVTALWLAWAIAWLAAQQGRIRAHDDGL
jgi:hypothetical protein